MREMNYYPSAVARGLQTRRMNTVGVVFPHALTTLMSNPYFAPVLDGILGSAVIYHQNTTLFTGHPWADLQHSLPVYCDGRCDGLLLIAPSLESDICNALSTQKVPFVLISDERDDIDVSSVDVDNAASARELVSHLLELGHRRIALLGGAANSGSATRRLEGYRQALVEHQVPVDPSLISFGAYIEESGYERARLLARWPADRRPTAIFGGNDAVALGAMQALREAGLRVPEDVSVVGFDDFVQAEAAGLTTVRQPLRRLGERAVELLMDRLEARDGSQKQELLPTELIVRQSTAPPPAGQSG